MTLRENFKEPVSAYILLGVNILALVWGAARLSASVEFLGNTVSDLKGAASIVANKINEHDTRIRVLEALEEKKNDTK